MPASEEHSTATAGAAFWSGPVRIALLAAIFAGVGFTLYQAATVRVFYWDSWEYLNEARHIAGDPTGEYRLFHAPLPQVALVPAVWITRSASVDEAIYWIAPRLTACLWTAFLLGTTYGWLRRRRGRDWAIFGVFVLMSTRLFVRYADYPMVDIPSAVWAVSAFWCYEVACERIAAGAGQVRATARWALLGLVFAGAILSKYSMVVLPLPFIAAELVRAAQLRALSRPHLEGLLLSGAVGIAASTGVVALVHNIAFGNFDPVALLSEFTRITATEWGEESPFDYLGMAWATISPVSLVLFVLGGLHVALRRARIDLAPTLWLLGYSALLVFGLEHNEVRYLWPLASVFAYFAVEGGVRVLSTVRPWLAHSSNHLTFSSAALVTALAIAAPAVDQMRRDLDPFFRTEVLADFTRFTSEVLSPDRPIFWEGDKISLTPDKPDPIDNDEFFNFFHVGPHTVAYLTRRPVGRVNSEGTPGEFLQGQAGSDNLLVLAPAHFAHATSWRAGESLPADFVVFAQRRVVLHRQARTFVDSAGLAFFHWTNAAGKLELRAARQLGRFSLFAMDGKVAVPVMRIAELGVGEELATGYPLVENEPPPALALVFDIERRFPASTASAASNE